MASKIRPTGMKVKPREISSITDEERAELTQALLEPPKDDIDAAKAAAEEHDSAELMADLEELFEIREMIDRYGKGEGKKYFEALRDRAAKAIAEGNSVLFNHGEHQFVAIRRQSHPIVVDDELFFAVFEGNEELLDAVAPRKISLPAFRQAVATGKISKDQLVQVAHIEDGTPYVQFYPYAG